MSNTLVLSRTGKDAPAWKRRLALLKNPWVNLAAMAAGVLLGLYVKPLARVLAPAASLYLSLLKMCVIPIIASAIVVSIGKMLGSGIMYWYLRRLLVVFVVATLLASAVGLGGGLLLQPGARLGESGRAFLGQAFLESEGEAAVTEEGVWGLVRSMVPSNVFSAFSQGEMLAILFVCIFLGTALGVMGNEASRQVLHTLSGVYEAFVKILDWILYLLPFGLLCLLSQQILRLGPEILGALAFLLLVYYGGCLLLCLVYLLAHRLATGRGLAQVADAFKEPLLISFVASSSIAATPVAIESLHQSLGRRRELASFVVPLAVVMNRQAYVLLFALTAVFVAQLFGESLTLGQCIVVLLGAAISGTAAVGAPAVVAPMLAYVLGPVGLPVAVGMTVLVAISPIIDPISSMTNLFGACATSTLTGNARPPRPEAQADDDAAAAPAEAG
jgi:Na+/H+-dicarboxylate symporter